MRRSTLIMLFFHLLLAMAVARAQQPDTLSLQEVEVSGQRIRTTQGSIPVQRLDALQLQHLSGNSVADAIRHFAGVHVKDYGGIGGLKTIQVRSLGAQHTGVFVDGVPMTDAATGQIDLGRLLIDLADDLSLTTGGSVELFQPARWYSQASALALQTISPDFAHQHSKARAGLRIGSFGLIQPFAMADIRVSAHSRAQLAGRYLKAHGTYPFLIRNGQQNDEWATRSNADVHNPGLQAKVIHQNGRHTLDYGAIFDHNNRGLPGAVTFYNPQASQRLANTDLSQHIRWNARTGSWRQQLLLRHALMHLHYEDPDFLNAQGHLEQNYRQQEYYLSHTIGTERGAYRFVAANDLTLNTLDAKHLTLDPRRFSWHQLVAAGWQNSRWESTAHLLWLHAFELESASGNPISHHPLSPGFSLAWRTAAHSTSKIRFVTKEAFRLPGFNDLYYNIVGNPVLKPEKATMFSLGWAAEAHRQDHHFRWQLDVFHHQLRDKIIAIPTKNLFVWSMRNLGKVSASGAEMSLNMNSKLSGQWQLNQHLSYTFQRAVDRSSPESPAYGHQIQYMPLHALNWFGQASHANGMWVALNAYFNSKRYYLPENTTSNQLPAWTTLDLSLGSSIHKLGLPAQVKAEVSNLLNAQYEVIRSFPMPGRAFHLTLTAHIE
ncbi:MAG: TonB-dependent receptor [Bacteroidetes bacterium]|nr:TonB-dependent receptor [Bacteroidota bacterium]